MLTIISTLIRFSLKNSFPIFSVDYLNFSSFSKKDPDFVHDETLYDELPFEKLDCKVGEELSLSLSG